MSVLCGWYSMCRFIEVYFTANNTAARKPHVMLVLKSVWPPLCSRMKYLTVCCNHLKFSLASPWGWHLCCLREISDISLMTFKFISGVPPWQSVHTFMLLEVVAIIVVTLRLFMECHHHQISGKQLISEHLRCWRDAVSLGQSQPSWFPVTSVCAKLSWPAVWSCFMFSKQPKEGYPSFHLSLCHKSKYGYFPKCWSFPIT